MAHQSSKQIKGPESLTLGMVYNLVSGGVRSTVFKGVPGLMFKTLRVGFTSNARPPWLIGVEA